MTLCKKGKKRQKRNHWKGGERSTLDAEKESLGGAGSLSWHQVGKEERTREATTSGDQDAPKNRLQSVAVGQLHRTKQHVWEGDLSKADMIDTGFPAPQIIHILWTRKLRFREIQHLAQASVVSSKARI